MHHISQYGMVLICLDSVFLILCKYVYTQNIYISIMHFYDCVFTVVIHHIMTTHRLSQATSTGQTTGQSAPVSNCPVPRLVYLYCWVKFSFFVAVVYSILYKLQCIHMAYLKSKQNVLELYLF